MSLPSEYVNAIYKDTGNPAYKGKIGRAHV